MKINPINSIYNSSHIHKKYITNKNSNQGNSKTNYTADNVKANFLPSFGDLKKVGEAEIIDRRTGKPVIATIKKENFGEDDITYKLYIKKKELGYMDMQLHSLIPDDDYKSSEKLPYEIFPEIKHLRTLSGDEYSGIGSTLINIAVNESQKNGYDGALWLITDKGFAKTLSSYRSNENPIPFYYKLGFKALDGNKDESIKKWINKSMYNMLPDSELLMLTPEAAKEKNKYFCENFTLTKKK